MNRSKGIDLAVKLGAAKTAKVINEGRCYSAIFAVALEELGFTKLVEVLVASEEREWIQKALHGLLFNVKGGKGGKQKLIQAVQSIRLKEIRVARASWLHDLFNTYSDNKSLRLAVLRRLAKHPAEARDLLNCISCGPRLTVGQRKRLEAAAAKKKAA